MHRTCCVCLLTTWGGGVVGALWLFLTTDVEGQEATHAVRRGPLKALQVVRGHSHGAAVLSEAHGLAGCCLCHSWHYKGNQL